MFKRKPKNQRRPWFRWNEPVGLPECPYLTRWLIDLRLFSIRVHHFVGSDDDRALHDHSWGFVTLILKGWYDDVGEHTTERMTPGTIRYRSAYHKHTVQTGPDGCWTIIFTGPRIREFGFWAENKQGKMRWWNSTKYFWRFGHHPCSDGTGVDKADDT